MSGLTPKSLAYIIKMIVEEKGAQPHSDDVMAVADTVQAVNSIAVDLGRIATALEKIAHQK